MRRVLVALVVVGLIAAAAVLGMRARLEARHRAVEIVLDGDDWLTLIRREGRDPSEILRDLRRRGATSLALSDTTLKRMAEAGTAAYWAGGSLAAQGRLGSLREPFRRLQAEGRIRTDAVYVTGPPETLAFVSRQMRMLLGAPRVRSLDGAVEVLGTQLDLEELGLGFRPQDAAPARRGGLQVVLRPRNFRGLAPSSLRALVNGYAATAPRPTLIFGLAEVQGYEGLLEDAAAEYRRIGARFGRIEVFTARRKQKGEDRLTALMRPEVIRVFSITPEELLVLRPGEVVEKFVRAAQERNIRLLYVRPLLFTPAGEPALEVNLRLVETIARDLRALGLAPGRARSLPPLEVPAPLTWLVALGAAALGALVLDDLARALGAPLSRRATWALLALTLAGTVGAGFTVLDGLWRQALALAVAVAGATGAVVWALPRSVRREAPIPGRRHVRVGRGLLVGWLTLLRAVALAVAAGTLVAALLSQWPFMLAISTFLGVKPAHVLPVALAAVLLTLGSRPVARWREAADEVGGWLARPLRLGSALLLLVVGLVAVALLARTGNISLPLLGAEQQLRSTLEAVLVARPRTKEFLIGYPALMLAGVAAAAGWRPAAVAFALAGTIGTAGAINSFAHLHTPLLYTFWRTGNALLLGSAFALPVALVLLWTARRLRS